MQGFSQEALSTLITVLAFGVLIVAVFTIVPQFTDMMISVIETSVM